MAFTGSTPMPDDYPPQCPSPYLTHSECNEQSAINAAARADADLAMMRAFEAENPGGMDKWCRSMERK